MTDEEIIQFYRRGIKVFREEGVDEKKIAAEPVAAVDHRDAPSDEHDHVAGQVVSPPATRRG